MTYIAADFDAPDATTRALIGACGEREGLS